MGRLHFGIVQLSEIGRLRISQVLCALYLVKLCVSITILAFGAHLKVSISKLKHVYTGYDDDTLPYIFIGVGLVSLLVNIFTALTCFAVQHIESRQKVSVALRILSLCNLGLGIALLVASVLCFTHTKELSNAFDRGLRQSMAEYAYDPNIKTQLDELQMDYHCCGNKGHEDWFNVGWILDKFNEPVPLLPKKHHVFDAPNDPPQSFFHRFRRDTAPELEGSSTTQDSVPFSCCDPSSKRPCVHRDVTNKRKHSLYDYTTHTLYKKGCNEVIMEYIGGTLLTAGGVFALTTFIIELFLIVITRYLQTSIQVSIDCGYFDADTPGYLFICPCIVEEEYEDDGQQMMYPSDGMMMPTSTQMMADDPNYYNDAGFASEEFDDEWDGNEALTYQPTYADFGEPGDVTQGYSQPLSYEQSYHNNNPPPDYDQSDYVEPDFVHPEFAATDSFGQQSSYDYGQQSPTFDPGSPQQGSARAFSSGYGQNSQRSMPDNESSDLYNQQSGPQYTSYTPDFTDE